MEESVRLRMISDVPLGCFLSGGIDSSVITALAAKQTKHLATFSIGFKDEPLFDETHYAL
jgi:asparagine synthase (glutamine-hydrolysing)